MLAQQARYTLRCNEAKAIYSPSIASFLPVSLDEQRCLATHDIGKSSNGGYSNNFIDAAFLRTLLNGNSLFHNMNAAIPLSVVLSDARFLTVLGSVTLDMKIR
eukprot:gb/GEZJ01004511.1/.p4 GENE.gb/GEZJ01004511.1/~~gb/GEZJ01004511.1/.p4  ORF type:complete len:103 (+),score=12.88 gb/GEZJ01004511.1/:3180-3488(+)